MSQRLKIDSLSSEGEGIGSFAGLKVFVSGALPLEEVEYEEALLKKNFAKGKVLQVITPSPLRKAPECPQFGSCGGCDLMHLSYEGQLKAKKKRVEEALQRIGGLEVKVANCNPSPFPLHYRNKIQLPIVWEGDVMKIGLYRKDSHEIIPLTGCFIQEHAGEKILHTLIPLLKKYRSIRTLLIRTGEEALITLVTWGKEDLRELGEKIHTTIPGISGVVENINTSENNVILSSRWKTLAGLPYFHAQLLGMRFKISAGAFFQVNTKQAENLFRTALEQSELKKSDIVWDAFCGVGTISLLAAPHVKKVIGTECFSEAIVNAKENATLNTISNVEFQTAKAEEFIERLPHTDAVFLNPPRKGCAQNLLRTIIQKKICRIVYVSCDPATLARDLKILVNGGYTISTVIPFDMFPQTMHVETLVYLKYAPYR